MLFEDREGEFNLIGDPGENVRRLKHNLVQQLAITGKVLVSPGDLDRYDFSEMDVAGSISGNTAVCNLAPTTTA